MNPAIPLLALSGLLVVLIIIDRLRELSYEPPPPTAPQVVMRPEPRAALWVAPARRYIHVIDEQQERDEIADARCAWYCSQIEDLPFDDVIALLTERIEAEEAWQQPTWQRLAHLNDGIDHLEDILTTPDTPALQAVA